MSVKNSLIALALSATSFLYLAAQPVVVDLEDYGIVPDTETDMSPKIKHALEQIALRFGQKDINLIFRTGQYHLYPDSAASREYYISNHDQPNPKAVGIALEGWENLTITGNGADFIFHGRMLPVSLVNSHHCTLRDFSIDFANPHIAQVTIEKSDEKGIVFRPAPWVKCRVDKSSHRFITYGKDWELTPMNGIAFDEHTRRLVYGTSDLYCRVDSVIELNDGTYYAPKWRDKRLTDGTRVVLRTWERPAPGIFLAESTDSHLENIRVHYAEGMGLLAQLCDSVSLSGFSVCLRGTDDPRYFTTQADATHFSGCKGHISSVDGIYEGMMDDAINVHGTYLRIISRDNDRTVTARYMHPQSYGFKWGEPGDSVQFISPRTMDLTGKVNYIREISPVGKSQVSGSTDMRIVFSEPLDSTINAANGTGIENLSWCPSVTFEGNIIRNNRARGSLFSTPRPTLVKNNLFDHTSGTAILLCGDCNGWYETGACRDVRIEGNTFINALTNMFQFTEGVISIYPEIPDLNSQKGYFHGGADAPGIVIENNRFVTFDHPILYAKSVDGLRFTMNSVVTSEEYAPFHHNKFTFKLQRVRNVIINNNNFDKPETVSIDIE